MTDEEKLLQIATRLLERTEAGGVQWNETADESMFETSMERYSVNVFKTKDGFPGLSVVNDSGRVIDTLVLNFAQEGSETLNNLHELARRDALRVEGALDDILKTLK